MTQAASTPASFCEILRKWIVRLRWPLLILGGLLTGFTVIFPQIGILEWIALIPALAVILTLAADQTVKYIRLYLMGLAFFFSFYLVNFHWFLYMYPLDFAGMTKGESAVVVMVAWMGLSLFQTLGAAVLFPLLGLALRRKWLSKHPILHPVLFAALWTCLEWYQSNSGWSGVPWARLPLGQAHILPTLQISSILGSYAVTFLIVAVNGFLTHLLLHANKRILCTALAGGLFLGNLSFGAIRMAAFKDEGTTVTVAAIQGNKGSLDYWSSGSLSEVMEVYGDLSREAAAEGADVIVWPETCVPYNVHRSERVYEYITELAAECGVPILCGVFTLRENSDADCNSIVAALPDGTLHDTIYLKRNPVPFGEFVPFREIIMTLIPPLAEINTLDEDIPAGEESVVFDLEGMTVGSLICFDSIYERNALDSVKNGAQLLAVSTNDSWFRDSRGVWMHHAQSRLRAIETGRWIVRSANTGVSSVISPTGDAVDTLGALKTGYALADARLSDRTTVYSVVGDIFAYACLVATACAVLCPIGYGMALRLLGKRAKEETS